jgi:hypothetical protein
MSGFSPAREAFGTGQVTSGAETWKDQETRLAYASAQRPAAFRRDWWSRERRVWAASEPAGLVPRYPPHEKEIIQMTESLENQTTAEDRSRNDSFVEVFKKIEVVLKDRLSRKGKRNAADLIQEYAELNPYWAKDHKDLDHLRQIRNFLIHEPGDAVVVTRRSHERLVEIDEGLEKTLVPISRRFKRTVITVKPDDWLAHVLKQAFEKEFSQFPVVDGDGEFRGLVTENEIARWLGRHVDTAGTTVDLGKVAVTAVLGVGESDRNHLPIYQFQSLEEPETEVMGLFMLQPMLEVVLLTASGTEDSKIEGIVTQWDAARYPSSPPATESSPTMTES